MPTEIPNPIGGFSSHNVQAWMVIDWSNFTGPDPKIALTPEFIFSIPDEYKTDEGIIIDLAVCSVDYGLNEIPVASAQTAVGRRADDTSILSTVHYLVKHFKMFLAASIYCQATQNFSTVPPNQLTPNNPWPVDSAGNPVPFRIFDGYIMGTGFRQTSQGVEYSLALVNWLSNLSFSSSVSRSSAAQNPSQLSNSPSLPFIDRNAGARLPAMFGQGNPSTQPLSIFNSAILQNDTWNGIPVGNAPDSFIVTAPVSGAIGGVLPGNAFNLADITSLYTPSQFGQGGLKGLLTAMCVQDRLNWQQLQFAICNNPNPIPNTVGKKNVEALSALQRIEPVTDGYTDGVPLRLKNFLGMDQVARQLAIYLGQELPDVTASYTIWDKLIGQFAIDMLFVVVPQVEKAMVVPFNPGLRKHWATIFASEYDFIEWSHNIPRPLRGVGLFINRGMYAGSNGANMANMPNYNIGMAYYENAEMRNGLIVWKSAPAWLSTITTPHVYQVAGVGSMVPSALNPNAGAAPLNQAPAQLVDNSKLLWCAYARSLYIQEILRGRTGRLSGRLRFDIAPGSIVRIEEPEDKFSLQILGGKQSYRWAQVVRVSCVINAEAKKAGTAIQFAFVRDQDENNNDAFSVDEHPMWACNWYGAPLVNMSVFYPGGKPGIAPPGCADRTILSQTGVAGITGADVDAGVVNAMDETEGNTTGIDYVEPLPELINPNIGPI